MLRRRHFDDRAVGTALLQARTAADSRTHLLRRFGSSVQLRVIVAPGGVSTPGGEMFACSACRVTRPMCRWRDE